MTDRETFIRAICEQPADDTVRLVFADWLEEHGEPERAEFIRLQIANADGSSSPREQSLTMRFLDDWFPDECCPGIRRGFSFNVEVTCAEFVKDGFAADLFSRVPVEKVALPDYVFCPRSRRDGQWILRVNNLGLREPPDVPATYLPSDFKTLLKGGEEYIRAYGDRMYGTEAEARSALSDACIVYGRREAKLPKLKPVPA